MTEHTPTPWAIGERERLIVREVPGMCDGGDCYSVAETKFHSLLLQDEAAANAAFIVNAVNSHDALVDALHGLIIGATCEVNEKGAGGYMLARLSDAKNVLGGVAPDRLTALVGGSRHD